MEGYKFDDISMQSWNNRTFPVLYAQDDFEVSGVAYKKDDVFDTYVFTYKAVAELITAGRIHTQTRINMRNAPLM